MKPSDIFIGVTDFFSVLLPGSLFTWFCYGYAPDTSCKTFSIFYLPNGETEQVALFLMLAYIVGNLLFATASKLDSYYDKYARAWFKKNNDICFHTARFIRDKSIDIKDWKTKLSKIGIEVQGELLENEKKYCKTEIVNTYKWAQHYIMANHPELLIDIKKFEADSKFFRSLVIAFILIALVNVIKDNNGMLFIGFMLLAFASFYRYCDLRHKSTERAYEVIVTLYHLPVQKNKADTN